MTTPDTETVTEWESGVTGDLWALVGSGAKYGTIYADPPWRYDNSAARAAVGDKYPTMSVEEICLLPVGNLAADRAHLHMWVTNAFLFQAWRIFEAWGFVFKSTFVWVKPRMGCGNYWRNSHEILLTGTKGALVGISKSEMSWVSRQRASHSDKPDEVRARIEKLSPGPRLELFGRREIPGWMVFGNQVERTILPPYRHGALGEPGTGLVGAP